LTITRAKKAKRTGVVVLLAALVAPEVQRHRRKRLLAHELALGRDDLFAVVVEDSDIKAEAARLELAVID
jgi:hypothetical protein